MRRLSKVLSESEDRSRSSMELLTQAAQGVTMEALNAVPVIHYFDTLDHRILCGVPGFDRSTKHARAVTCPACVERLHDAQHPRPVESSGTHATQ